MSRHAAPPPKLDHAGRHHFAHRLAAALAKAELNQSDLAKQTDCTQSLVNMVLRGKRTPPLDAIERWADALRLKGGARNEFLDLAALAHAPERIAKNYLSLLDRLRRLEEKVASL